MLIYYIMNLLTDDIMFIIFNHINTRKIKYQPFGDGEQNYTLIYDQLYPINCVNKRWNSLIHINKRTPKL